ncbi:hypothetical protein ACIP2X_33120 [Streptomyces sp. NPDC089424]|uniref:hypothetical protein n=1 Tax=Streptomyces sp. NPDC089424 TaxID=3365917 RepID=UPI0038270281
MSGHGQLAQTGAPVLVVGGTAYPIGGWMLALAAALVCLGLLTARFGYRRNLAASQASKPAAHPRRHRG